MATHMTTTKIDFLGYRYICFALSLILLASFIGGAYYKYQTRGSVFLYSVDFTGGTQVLLDFSKPVSGEQVKKILEDNGISGAAAREFSDHEVLIRVKPFKLAKNVAAESGAAQESIAASGDRVGHSPEATAEAQKERKLESQDSSKDMSDSIRDVLAQNLTDTKVTVVQTDSVGVGISDELGHNSLWAVIIALILMLIYLGARFWSFSYGIGSVVALMHDVLVILSFILWFDYEISMNVIGAVLFILGYSVNDTIVIFARIRENIAKKQGMPLIDIMNLSINETLRRTLLTSFATLLMVVALVAFGGEVLRLLSVSVLIGIVFGTYSSIYVASPVMLLFYKDVRHSK